MLGLIGTKIENDPRHINATHVAISKKKP